MTDMMRLVGHCSKISPRAWNVNVDRGRCGDCPCPVKPPVANLRLHVSRQHGEARLSCTTRHFQRWSRSTSSSSQRVHPFEGDVSVDNTELPALQPISSESLDSANTSDEPTLIDELPGLDPVPDPAVYQLPQSFWPRGVPDLQTTSSESLLRVRKFQYRHICRAGELVFQPLTPKWLPQAVELLTDSFADLMGPLTFRPLLRLQVRVYLQQRLLLVPAGVTLVGLQLPEDAAAPARLVATVELSLADAVRPQFLTLNPPLGTAYLCNMAVQPDLRRQGVGSGALCAAELLSQQVGLPSMYLHCRLVDQGAHKLYLSTGYVSQDMDSYLYTLLLFRRRRSLMRKELKGREGAEGEGLPLLNVNPVL